MNHSALGSLGNSFGRLAAPVAMGEGSSPALVIGCQNPPGVARADTHQFSRLIQGDALREEAVQNLKSGLFFLRQCHILHRVSVTFMLVS